MFGALSGESCVQDHSNEVFVANWQQWSKGFVQLAEERGWVPFEKGSG
jgi:hypothetical protein